MSNAPNQLEAMLAQALDHPWRGLRSDLRLHRGTENARATPTWLLEDPVSGSTYQFKRDEHALLLCLLGAPSLSIALRRYAEQFGQLPDAMSLLQFLQRLQTERLAIVREPAPADVQPVMFGVGGLQKLIFTRIPVLEPDQFLQRTLPIVSRLWSMPMRWLFLLIGLLGVGFALPQYEIYFSSAGYLQTPQGLALFTLSLVVLKICHEFAHAYTAKAQGLYVRSIGVALIAFWPVLYTDTTEAWKLSNRRKRFWIDSAGVGFELVVAGLALLLWATLPPGILRNLMFFLSGVSILTSLFVNLNPLMRFDGYYMLMDIWGIDNLQPRAIALWKHALRRLLWDWQGPIPEIHPQYYRLIGYAGAVALYRVFIAVVISVAIYTFFQPLIGVLVFLAIGWLLLLRPIVQEGVFVWQHRELAGRPWRWRLTLLAIAGLVVLLLLPLQRTDRFPAFVVAKDALTVTAPAAGELTTALPMLGQAVAAGEVLANMHSDALQFQQTQLQLEVAQIQTSLQNLATAGEQGGYRQWLSAELARVQAELATYQQAIAQQQVVAPRSAVVVDRHPDLIPGSSVARESYLLTLADPTAYQVHVFVHEAQLADVTAGTYQTGELQCDMPGFAKQAVRLNQPRSFPVSQLLNDSLYDVAGGPIPSREDPNNRRVPRDTHYRFIYDTEHTPTLLPHGTPCKVWLGKQRQSLLGGWVQSLGRLLAKEGIT